MLPLDPHAYTIYGMLCTFLMQIAGWAIAWALIYSLQWVYVVIKRKLHRNKPQNS